MISADAPTTEQIPSFCALCISRCGATATVENGRFVALKHDPSHPTGKALCIKGKVAPELVYHPDRLLYPMKRTRPKGDADPGWQRISWDEALDTVAKKLTELSDRFGPETVAFNNASPSTSALSDAVDWVRRLRRAFGSPNQSISMELCGWGRYLANIYSYGAGLPADCMPDLENAGCILFWGYNPTVSRIAHATATVAAQSRGARLIVVDPRNAGLARKADQWLRVRPGSDGALALGLAHVMIEQGWYDDVFVRDWTNGPLLIRADTGRFLRERDLDQAGAAENYLAWDETNGRPVAYDPSPGSYAADTANLAISGSFDVETLQGSVTCRPAFQLVTELCARYDPKVVERITGVEAGQVERTAQMLWQSRPVAYMAWSGLEQQSNATQIARAIGLVYALTGSFDAKGGNVQFPAVPSANVQGEELLSAEQRAKTLGFATLRCPWPGQFRLEPARRTCRWRARAQGAGSPGFSRSCRFVHEPERGDGRYCPADDQPIRIRRVEDRLRDKRSGLFLDPIAQEAGRASGGSTFGYPDHFRSRVSPRPRPPFLGREHRCRLSPPTGAEWGGAGNLAE
jgi:anaerobic selenocysteine-containing dehydrogenase